MPDNPFSRIKIAAEAKPIVDQAEAQLVADIFTQAAVPGALVGGAGLDTALVTLN